MIGGGGAGRRCPGMSSVPFEIEHRDSWGRSIVPFPNEEVFANV